MVVALNHRRTAGSNPSCCVPWIVELFWIKIATKIKKPGHTQHFRVHRYRLNIFGCSPQRTRRTNILTLIQTGLSTFQNCHWKIPASFFDRSLILIDLTTGFYNRQRTLDNKWDLSVAVFGRIRAIMNWSNGRSPFRFRFCSTLANQTVAKEESDTFSQV